MPTYNVAGNNYTVLFPDLLRPLTQAEESALRASVEALGVLTPVVVDETAGIIDGGNRMRIAAELGLEDVPLHILPGLSLDEKRELAEALNLDRRHLSPEDQQARREARIARVAASRTEGKSTRQIAEEEGVSVSQVRSDLAKATAQGCAVEPEGGKVQGKDGKKRPARKPKPKPKALENGVGAVLAEANGQAEKNGTLPPILRDQVGIPVPPALADIFEHRELFAKARGLLRDLAKVINEIAQHDGGVKYRPQLSLQGKAEVWKSPRLQDELAQLGFAEPYAAVCPWCHHDGPKPDCGSCRGRGWVVKQDWTNAPEDYRRQALADLAASKGAKA